MVLLVNSNSAAVLKSLWTTEAPVPQAEQTHDLYLERRVAPAAETLGDFSAWTAPALWRRPGSAKLHAPSWIILDQHKEPIAPGAPAVLAEKHIGIRLVLLRACQWGMVSRADLASLKADDLRRVTGVLETEMAVCKKGRSERAFQLASPSMTIWGCG